MSQDQPKSPSSPKGSSQSLAQLQAEHPMTLGEVRYKLRHVISNGHPERMRLVTRDSIYIISLAWCGLNGDDKEEFEWELQNDYQILLALQRLSHEHN